MEDLTLALHLTQGGEATLRAAWSALSAANSSDTFAGALTVTVVTVVSSSARVGPTSAAAADLLPGFRIVILVPPV